MRQAGPAARLAEDAALLPARREPLAEDAAKPAGAAARLMLPLAVEPLLARPALLEQPAAAAAAVAVWAAANPPSSVSLALPAGQ